MTDQGHVRLKAGIIGLSWIAADPAGEASSEVLGSAPPYSHASAMAAVGGIDVVSACDLRPEARAAFLDTWSGQWPGVEVFDDVDAMLQRPLDLVSIVTPDHIHASMIEKCIDAGVPMIFSEKPFTTDLDEADRLLRHIAKSGATVSVNHTWRWRPDIIEAMSLVSSGRLGPLSQVTIEAGGPRAMLFRNLSHFIDLAIYVVGNSPEWVMGELEGGEEYGLDYSGDGGSNADLDPGAWAMIGFPDDVRAYVSGEKSGPADVVIQIECSEGRITIDALGGRIVENPRTNDGTPVSVSGPAIRPLKPRFTRSGMEAGLADLISSHRSGREPSGTARTARETVAVIDAILRSSQSGSRVDVRRPS